MKNWGARKAIRVTFERGVDVDIIAIDGTWRRPCKMIDVSESGAKLVVSTTIEGLQLKEFFLLLSKTGKVYRRCELVRVNGDEIGVQFLKAAKPKQS